MNAMRKRSSARRRRGLTLVEAVAGTVLLGTLMTGLLLAHVRMLRQARRAELRLEACSVADGLMAAWWADRANLPREGTGPVQGRPGWSWRTRTRESEVAAAFLADVVVLRVFAPDLSPGEHAVELEVMVPREKQKPKSGRPDAR
jgi:Tfp pilus assembly protein PilV